MDTIYAVASGRVPCAIAVVRLSGPACRFVIETMCGSIPKPRQAAVRSIRSRDGLEIDKGLVLW